MGPLSVVRWLLATDHGPRTRLDFELPGGPHLAAEPLVGFLILEELLRGGIPLELLAAADADVADVADRHRAVADLHVADRPLPAAQAVTPVAHVVARYVQALGVLGQGLQHLRPASAEGDLLAAH